LIFNVRFFLFAITALGSACSTNPPLNSLKDGLDTAGSEAPFVHQPSAYHVSMAQLTANPHQFDGKRVVVSGFLKRVRTRAGELLA